MEAAPTGTSMETPEEVIKKYLAYQDVGSEAEKNLRLHNSPRDPIFLEYAEALLKAAREEGGIQKIVKHAKAMRSVTAENAKALGLPLSWKARSISSAMEDLAKRYYLSLPENQDKRTPEDGNDIANPIGNSPQAKEQRWQIVDRRLGIAAEEAYLRNTKKWKDTIKDDSLFALVVHQLDPNERSEGEKIDPIELGALLRNIVANKKQQETQDAAGMSNDPASIASDDVKSPGTQEELDTLLATDLGVSPVATDATVNRAPDRMAATPTESERDGSGRGSSDDERGGDQKRNKRDKKKPESNSAISKNRVSAPVSSILAGPKKPAFTTADNLPWMALGAVGYTAYTALVAAYTLGKTTAQSIIDPTKVLWNRLRSIMPGGKKK